MSSILTRINSINNKDHEPGGVNYHNGAGAVQTLTVLTETESGQTKEERLTHKQEGGRSIHTEKK